MLLPYVCPLLKNVVSYGQFCSDTSCYYHYDYHRCQSQLAHLVPEEKICTEAVHLSQVIGTKRRFMMPSNCAKISGVWTELCVVKLSLLQHSTIGFALVSIYTEYRRYAFVNPRYTDPKPSHIKSMANSSAYVRCLGKRKKRSPKPTRRGPQNSLENLTPNQGSREWKHVHR